MTLIEHAERIVMEAMQLNAEVRKLGGEITLGTARRLDSKVREAEGWLLGIRKVLLWPTVPPDDETPEGSPPSAPLP